MDAAKDEKTLEYATFSLVDYCLFLTVLSISVLIGVYFGFYKKQKTTNDYLLGGRNMGVFPIALSLAASYVSALTLLGMPSEIYSYGTQYTVSCLGVFYVCYIVANVYLPVFYELKVTSSFEYLSLRYNNKVRLMASFLCLFSLITHIPVVLYAPSLAVNLVTGIDIEYTNPLLGLVCIFYTAVGGFKAVVWSDAIQFLTMNSAILAVIIIGVYNEGGLSNIWKIADEANRLEFFDFDPSMYKRTTFWSMMLGMGTQWVSAMGIHQMCVQRFLSVPSMNEAKKVLYIFAFLAVMLKASCLFTGLIVFAKYSGCDPLAAGIISKPDQILPYYILDTAKNVPGIPGLFTAGLVSAALSTLSTLLNTACVITYKDFICLLLPFKLSEITANRVLKSLVVIIGIICVGLSFFLKKLGNVLEITIQMSGLTAGTMLGIFTIGMLSKRVNTKCIFIGTLASFGTTLWMFIGNYLAKQSGVVFYPRKPFSIEKCDHSLNITLHVDTETTVLEDRIEEVFPMFRLSFMWYSLIGCVLLIVVSLLASLVISPNNEDRLKEEYFSPFIRRYLFGKNKATEQEMTLMKEKLEINLMNNYSLCSYFI